jgi:hypothetical protein
MWVLSAFKLQCIIQLLNLYAVTMYSCYYRCYVYREKPPAQELSMMIAVPIRSSHSSTTATDDQYAVSSPMSRSQRSAGGLRGSASSTADLSVASSNIAASGSSRRGRQ